MSAGTLLATLGVTLLPHAAAAAAAASAGIVAQGGLAAIVAPAAALPDHAARLRRAAAAAAAVPTFAPVGRGAADAHALKAWLAAERATLGAALDRLEGCAEWIASCRLPAAEAPRYMAQTSGAGWLRARAAESQAEGDAARRAESVLTALATRLGVHARAWRLARFDGGSDLAILAARDAGPVLRALSGPDRDALRLSGPWPAYSFVAPAPAERAA